MPDVQKDGSDHPPAPAVTVLTVTYEDAVGLRRTIASVAEQRGIDFEYVVVDGGSRDDTEQVAKHPRVDSFLSKPDRGISHAFNRGIELARGRRMLFLNAGDVLVGSDALARLASHAPAGQVALVTGQVDCGPKGVLPRRAPGTRRSARARAHLAHQATLIPRELFDLYGRYDESFRIRMDYEWLLRVIDRVPIVWVPEVFVSYELGGLSSDPRRALQQEIEGTTAEMLHAGSTLSRVGLLVWRGPLTLVRALAKRILWSFPALDARVSRLRR